MSTELQLFKCPSCGATLEIPAGQKMMKCTYCNSSVIVPGEGDSGSTVEQSTDTFDAGGCSRLGRNIALAAAALLVAGAIGVFVLLKQHGCGIASRPFADSVLAFGQKGIGAGMLNDPRSVGVDHDGKIYAGDFNDGRVNIFDATGKFLRLIHLGNDTCIRSMAVAPDGTLYLSYDGKIHRLNAKGNDTQLGYADEYGHPVYFDSIVLGTDGSLVAACQSEKIIRFGPDGTVNLTIPKAFSSVTGHMELDVKLAVDGLGNIYALGTFNNLVLKYNANGKYVDQFGGKTEHPAEGVDEGRFQAAEAITVDGHGRIFVSDIWGIQVFDDSGRFLKFFKLDGVAFGMAFDLSNDLYVASNKPAIIKLRIQAP